MYEPSASSVWPFRSTPNLARNGLLGPQFAVVGMAIEPLDDAEFRRRMSEATTWLSSAW